MSSTGARPWAGSPRTFLSRGPTRPAEPAGGRRGLAGLCSQGQSAGWAGAGFAQEGPHYHLPTWGRGGPSWSERWRGRAQGRAGWGRCPRALGSQSGGLGRTVTPPSCKNLWVEGAGLGSAVSVPHHPPAQPDLPTWPVAAPPPAPSGLSGQEPAPASGVLGYQRGDSAGGEVTGTTALTGTQLLLQEGDLLAQRVNAVQLLEGVGQEAARVREPVLQGPRGQAVKRGQHELQLLRGRQRARWGRACVTLGQPLTLSVPQGFKDNRVASKGTANPDSVLAAGPWTSTRGSFCARRLGQGAAQTDVTQASLANGP